MVDVAKAVKYKLPASVDSKTQLMRTVDAYKTTLVLEGGSWLGVGYKYLPRLIKAEEARPGSKVKIDSIYATSAGACAATFIALNQKPDKFEKFTDEENLANLLDADKEWMKEAKRQLNEDLAKEKKQLDAAEYEKRLQKKLMEVALSDDLPKSSGVSRLAHKAKNLFTGGVYKGHLLKARLAGKINEVVIEALQKYYNELLKQGNLEKIKNFKKVLREKIVYTEVDKVTKIKKRTTANVINDKVSLAAEFTFNHMHILKEAFSELGFEDLYIGGYNLGNKAKGIPEGFEVFSHEHPVHKHMPIALADRISMSIPRFFKPVEYNGSMWIDGGVFSNYPIAAVKNPLQAIGFKLDTRQEIHDFWYKQLRPGFLTRNLVNPVKNSIKKRFARGVDFTKHHNAEFNLVKDQFALQTVQIPTYNTLIDVVDKILQTPRERLFLDTEERNRLVKEPRLNEVVAKVNAKEQLNSNDRAILKQCKKELIEQNKKFTIFNFNATEEQKNLIEENGQLSIENHLTQHRNELLSLNVWALKDMPNKNLQELHKLLLDPDKAKDQIAFEGDATKTFAQSRQEYLHAIQQEFQHRLAVRKLFAVKIPPLPKPVTGYDLNNRYNHFRPHATAPKQQPTLWRGPAESKRPGIVAAKRKKLSSS